MVDSHTSYISDLNLGTSFLSTPIPDTIIQADFTVQVDEPSSHWLLATLTTCPPCLHPPVFIVGILSFPDFFFFALKNH